MLALSWPGGATVKNALSTLCMANRARDEEYKYSLRRSRSQRPPGRERVSRGVGTRLQPQTSAKGGATQSRSGVLDEHFLAESLARYAAGRYDPD